MQNAKLRNTPSVVYNATFPKRKAYHAPTSYLLLLPSSLTRRGSKQNSLGDCFAPATSWKTLHDAVKPAKAPSCLVACEERSLVVRKKKERARLVPFSFCNACPSVQSRGDHWSSASAKEYELQKDGRAVHAPTKDTARTTRRIQTKTNRRANASVRLQVIRNRQKGIGRGRRPRRPVPCRGSKQNSLGDCFAPATSWKTWCYAGEPAEATVIPSCLRGTTIGRPPPQRNMNCKKTDVQCTPLQKMPLEPRDGYKQKQTVGASIARPPLVFPQTTPSISRRSRAQECKNRMQMGFVNFF